MPCVSEREENKEAKPLGNNIATVFYAAAPEPLGALPNGPIFCTAWCLIDFIVQLDLDLRYLLNYEILSLLLKTTGMWVLVTAFGRLELECCERKILLPGWCLLTEPPS